MGLPLAIVLWLSIIQSDLLCSLILRWKTRQLINILVLLHLKVERLSLVFFFGLRVFQFWLCSVEMDGWMVRTYRVLEMMWPMQLLCSPAYNTLYLIFEILTKYFEIFSNSLWCGKTMSFASNFWRTYSFAPHDYFSHWVYYYCASNGCIHWIHCIYTSSNYYRLLIYERTMDWLLSMLLQCLDLLCANLKYLSYSNLLSRRSVFQFHILCTGKSCCFCLVCVFFSWGEVNWLWVVFASRKSIAITNCGVHATKR